MTRQVGSHAVNLGGGVWAHADLAPLLSPVEGDGDHPALAPHPRNARNGDVDAIGASVRANGLYRPIYVQLSTGFILAGNHTYAACMEESDGALTHMPVVWLDVNNEQALRILLADNRTADLGDYDDALLLELLQEMTTTDQSLLGTGWMDDEVAELEAAMRAAEHSPLERDPNAPSLADRFIVPPFTMLDQRSGSWQDRKRQWLRLGIRSEVGRDGHDAAPGRDIWLARGTEGQAMTPMTERYADAYGYKPSAVTQDPDYADKKHAAQERLGRKLSRAEFEREHYTPVEALPASGVSVFDPVLCELAMRWFVPPGGQVLDPFAGGSVRGIVAAALGRGYTGIELRGEQVAANEEQADLILHRLHGDPARPTWHAGDSRTMDDLLPEGEQYDAIFSCPPYADLEVYSDDPADISGMTYPEFLTAYRQIIAAAVSRLAEDRFAVWVVGEVRDRRDGTYRGFVGDTVTAFQDAGAAYYNEAILVSPVGSLPVRAGRTFTSSRKMGKTHQNVLVFCKGDPRKATAVCGNVEVTMPDWDVDDAGGTPLLDDSEE